MIREKQGLIEIVHKISILDTRIIVGEYSVLGYVSYIFYFPWHLYEEIKNRIFESKINRKT